MGTSAEVLQLFTGLVLALVGATLAASALRRWGKQTGRRAIIVQTLFARINAWWAMVVALSLAGLAGRLGIVLLFAIISFAALREFLTLTAKRRADHWMMMFAFFAALPLQYLLVYIGWVGLFTIFIPVYAFLFLPVLAAMRGDTSGFLSRVAETQWALMLCIFAASHVPALLWLDIPGFAGKQILLIAWLVIVVQAADIAHFVTPRLMGRTRIAPKVHHSRSWEGFLGALGTGILTAPVFGGTGAEDFSIASQFGTQLTAVLITVIWSGVVSAILFKVIDAVIGLRPSADVETQGLDLPTHGETAYHS